MTREYVENQKSIAQIARELGCSRSTITSHLLEHGMDLRRDGLPKHYRKSQLSYGEKMKNGRVVQHLGEVRTIEQFISMRRSGLSFAKLAKWANDNDIPTKNRVGAWDRRTIFEILRRNHQAVENG